MFGYIVTRKDELKVREYNTFRAYYCGLCFAVKERFGTLVRMTLSNDAAFIALLLDSVFPEPPAVHAKRCIANPLKKRPVVGSCEVLDYCAAVNVILVYFKLRDDIHDSHSAGAIAAFPFMYPSARKARKRLPEIFDTVSRKLEALSRLENEKCGDIDRTAHAFAELMGELFSSYPLLAAEEKRILSRLGYLLGRFIYILDAYDDLAADRRKNQYNPFIYAENPPAAEELKQSLIFTLSEAGLCYELLDIKKNKPILDNVIYLGLNDSLNKAFDKDSASA